MSRRTAAIGVLVAFGALLCARAARGDDRLARIDAALERTATWLVEQQDQDGAWRSGIHGSFRDGPSLTPHVLTALYFLQPGPLRSRPAVAASYERGVNYLRARTRSPHGDSAVPEDLTFPVYTAAAASWVMVLNGSSTPAVRQEQNLWLAVVRRRQLNQSLGWDRDDLHFGGWGYSPDIPRKPAGSRFADQPHANLSATVFALGALRMANAKLDQDACADALVFIDRCQNFSDHPAHADDRFDDGGFFFAPDDPAGSKAGVAGVDAHGRQRLHSYGSMTCDGIRAMLACGRPPTHPRVIAARHWLERHFTVTTNAGTFAADRAALRDGAYFYYGWSLTHALQRLRITSISTPASDAADAGDAGDVNWAAALTDELLSRQRGDGAWANRISDSREDEPLVATPFAASALLICRQQLATRAPAP